MKYLKSYEDAKHIYNKEKWWKGTEECSTDKAIEIIKGLKEWSFNDYKIERHVCNLPPIVIIDPKQYDRKSANTKNYYTVIVDNSPLWEKFPKRSKSLICGLKNMKKMYIEKFDHEYVVIPFDGSKWGLTTTYDFWYTFRNSKDSKIFDDLSDINEVIYDIARKLNVELPSDMNITQLKDNFSILDQEIKKEENDNTLKKLIGNFGWRKIQFGTVINAAKTIGIYEWYHDFLNPVENGIKCYTYPELQKNQYLWGGDFEVWTDSKCLLVQCNLFSKIMGEK